MMLTKTLLLAATLLGSALAGPPTNPNGVFVESISYGGSGCPQNSVTASYASDRTTFTLLFDSFIAQVGPNLPATDARKNCQINVNLHVPMGWAYSVMQVDYRGYVSLDAGINAQMKSVFYWQGSVIQTSSVQRFAGPVSKDYTTRDTTSFESKIWSDCKQQVPFNINTQVSIDKAGNNGRGQMTADALDGKVTYDLKLLWQRC
jgi:hypothetical protein